jgi:site-specific recombinase XerD
MNLQAICEQYAAFRKTLGERFETNGRQLKAFCRAMGPNIDIAEVSPEKVNTFLVGKGPLTTSWYVRHNALLGFYRYAISRGFVATSPLPLAIPKQPPAFQPYIYSPVELRRILDSIGSCRRRRSHLDAPTMRCLVLLMYGAALRTSEALLFDDRRCRSFLRRSYRPRFEVLQNSARADRTQDGPDACRIRQSSREML